MKRDQRAQQIFSRRFRKVSWMHHVQRQGIRLCLGRGLDNVDCMASLHFLFQPHWKPRRGRQIFPFTGGLPQVANIYLPNCLSGLNSTWLICSCQKMSFSLFGFSDRIFFRFPFCLLAYFSFLSWVLCCQPSLQHLLPEVPFLSFYSSYSAYSPRAIFHYYLCGNDP